IELPALSPKQPLLDALADIRNWTAALPTETEVGVSLAEAKPSDKAVLVHPLGRVTARQKVVPLDQTITKFGNAAPQGANHFAISKVTFNGSTRSHEDVEDYFAPGQFKQLSDAASVTASSYDSMQDGMTAGAAATDRGNPLTVTLHYQTRVLDNRF